MQTLSLATVCNRFPPVKDDAPALALAPANLRILIVNECMHSAGALKSTLHDLGYFTTFTAYSGRRALTAAADFYPSVSILDLELPDMTGYQLAQRLRSHLERHIRQMPLLAIAESPRFGNFELTRAAGFIGCLSKPVLPVELNTILRKMQSYGFSS
jgi:CheY-like chemotaxis protein